MIRDLLEVVWAGVCFAVGLAACIATLYGALFLGAWLFKW